MCAEAVDGQILVPQRVLAGSEDIAVTDSLGELMLRWVRPRRSRLQRHRLEGGRGDDVIVQRDEDVTSLVELDDAERYERFDRLQQQMSDVWAQMGRHTPGESVVVIPSVDLPRDSAGS